MSFSICFSENFDSRVYEFDSEERAWKIFLEKVKKFPKTTITLWRRKPDFWFFGDDPPYECIGAVCSRQNELACGCTVKMFRKSEDAIVICDNGDVVKVPAAKFSSSQQHICTWLFRKR